MANLSLRRQNLQTLKCSSCGMLSLSSVLPDGNVSVLILNVVVMAEIICGECAVDG